MAGSYTTGPNAGPNNSIDSDEWVAWNRTGSTLVVGDFVLFDDLGTETETAAATGGPLGNLVMPATTTIGVSGAATGHRGCVVVDLLPKNDGSTATPGGDNTLVRVRVRGRVKAKLTTGAAYVYGNRLGGTNASTAMVTVAADGPKHYAFADEEIGSAVAGTLYNVHLEGIAGFGWTV